MIDRFTDEQVASFHRDGFLIVEGGFVSDAALERLRERFARVFDGGSGQRRLGPESRYRRQGDVSMDESFFP